MSFSIGDVGKGIVTGGLSFLADGLRPGGINMGDYNQAVSKSLRQTGKAYDTAMGRFDPYMETATVGGLDQMFKDIGSSSLYSSLMDERGKSLADVLGGTGVTRSGYGRDAASNLSTDTILGLEGLLTGRQFQGAQALGGLDIGRANALSNIRTGGAAAGIGAQQQQQQADAAMLSGLLNLGGNLGGAALMCDSRLKANKSKIGELPMQDGEVIALYSYDANAEGERVGSNI